MNPARASSRTVCVAGLFALGLLVGGCATTEEESECTAIMDPDAHARCLAEERAESERKAAERERTRAVRRAWKQCADGMVDYYRQSVNMGVMTRTQAQTQLRLTLRQRCGEKPMGTSIPML
ncbi:MAG: DUF2309 family protein [Gammaproteobacteria bacterium]|nr:DUF2309 family protein [Gammaproteobacteria bacterium]